MENILGFNHYGRFQHEIEIVNCGHYFGSDWGDCYRGGKKVGANSGNTGNCGRGNGYCGTCRLYSTNFAAIPFKILGEK